MSDERAIVFLVEEDYLHTPDVLVRLIEFFHAYNPRAHTHTVPTAQWALSTQCH